jgi:hypothetical protein
VGHVEITAVRWATRVLRAGKTKAPLHICVAEPSQANLLIDRGLVWDYQLHNCEPFSGDCQVTQCFNCYQYGHTARMCGNIAKCGFCAAPGHITNNCPVKTDPAKYRCTTCATPEAKHTAWSTSCPKRKERVEKARNYYYQRPTRFQEGSHGATPSQMRPSSPRPTQQATPAATASTSPQHSQDSEQMDITLGCHAGQKRAAPIDPISSDEEDSPVRIIRLGTQQADTGGYTTVRRRGKPRWNSTAPQGSQDTRGLMASTLSTPSQ